MKSKYRQVVTDMPAAETSQVPGTFLFHSPSMRFPFQVIV